MTDDDNVSAKSIKEKMKYYSYQGDYLYRAWKYFPGIITGENVTHYPIFPDLTQYKFYPSKLVLRHYTFRTASQALKNMDAKLRNSDNDNKNQNHYYEKTLKKDFTKKVDHKLLSKYNEDGNWNYEVKYCPFTWLNPPKREDIFTDEGFLRIPQKTILDYRRMIDTERKRIIPYKIKYIYKNLIKKLTKENKT